MDTPGSFFNLATTELSALVMGGWGVTTPSWVRTPIFNGWLGSIWEFGLQGIGISAGSESQGFASMMTFMKSAIPPRLALRGPTTAEMVSAPAIMDDQPSVGTRKAVGLKP